MREHALWDRIPLGLVRHDPNSLHHQEVELPLQFPETIKAGIRRVICWSVAAVLTIVALGLSVSAVSHISQEGRHAPAVRGR